MITKAIKTAFNNKKNRNWDKLYWCIDLHDTIITGTYNKNNNGSKIAPNAIEVLSYLTGQEDHVLILWTSSYIGPVGEILKRLKQNGVEFNYVNENPECPNTDICDFTSKFYFNILIDDKSGFDLNTDWGLIKKELIDIKVQNKEISTKKLDDSTEIAKGGSVVNKNSK